MEKNQVWHLNKPEGGTKDYKYNIYHPSLLLPQITLSINTWKALTTAILSSWLHYSQNLIPCWVVRMTSRYLTAAWVSESESAELCNSLWESRSTGYGNPGALGKIITTATICVVMGIGTIDLSAKAPWK